MYSAPSKTCVSASYKADLYRVDTDIPAGTYEITLLDSFDLEDSTCSTADSPAFYLMSGLDFMNDSITNTAIAISVTW